MRNRKTRAGVTIVCGVALAAALAAGSLAAVSKFKGTITADGSSTVGPYTATAAELFTRKESDVKITVGISGTGGGFQRFCNGEIDLADASRPISQSREVPNCVKNGIKYVAFTVANDGIAIVVNKKNTWVKNSCISTEQLKRIWEPGSKVNSWKDIDPSYPNVDLKLFGPGTDSGTFDFFTEKINGRARASRSNYLPSENDQVTVRGVSGEDGGMGYFGYSYYLENNKNLKLLAVNAGNGCIAPNVTTVQTNRYKPLSRPLFIYAKRTSFKRTEVRAFIGYIFNNERAIAQKARFISLTDKQLAKARYQYRQAVKDAQGG